MSGATGFSSDRLRDFEQVYVLLVPSGLGIPPNLLFVLFYTLAIQTALWWCVVSGGVPGQAGPV